MHALVNPSTTEENWKLVHSLASLLASLIPIKPTQTAPIAAPVIKKATTDFKPHRRPWGSGYNQIRTIKVADSARILEPAIPAAFPATTRAPLTTKAVIPAITA